MSSLPDLPPLPATLKYPSKHAHLFPAATVRQVYRTGASASPLPPPLAPSPNSVSELMCRGLSAANRVARPGKAERGVRHQAKVVNEAECTRRREGGGDEMRRACRRCSCSVYRRKRGCEMRTLDLGAVLPSHGVDVWVCGEQAARMEETSSVRSLAALRADEQQRCRGIRLWSDALVSCTMDVGRAQERSRGEVAWSHSCAILLPACNLCMRAAEERRAEVACGKEKERREKVVLGFAGFAGSALIMPSPPYVDSQPTNIHIGGLGGPGGYCHPFIWHKKWERTEVLARNFVP
ncbi:hypothetical protein K438DRAFT_1766273 [Mycena galopus ATCC 62051]|nr:hypothetical protein K438DRAFT_1766273 [Mycena galopus ATCC 62051]